MDIKKLKLHNYKSHKDTEIEFNEPFYMIVGEIQGECKSNGSGKSSIAEAISYAPYGNADTGVSNDSLIYNDEDKMFVEETFELNGEEIIIKRSVKRGSSPVLKITKNGEEFKPGLKAGQQMINDILGADFNVYKNTSYFKQGDLNSFSVLTPKEAKEVLINILQLNNYNKYEQLAKDMSNKVQSSIIDLNNKIYKVEGQIKSEKEKNNRPKVTKEDLNNLEDKLKELEFHKNLSQALSNSKQKAKKEIETKRAELKKVNDPLAYKITELNNKIKKLETLSNKNVCPTCEGILNKEDIGKVIKLIKEEREPILKEYNNALEIFGDQEDEEIEINSIEIDVYSHEQGISEINYKIGEVKTILQILKEDEILISKLESELQSYIQTVLSKEELKESYNKLQVAFGKKGIQAHIIDSVIPEIQATTNDILEGLETRIRLSIESQKELKKGGKGETLDINVITEFGERPYSNYSGGEKTLIDFALRIALSVILTRRSNCQIQTLILDEVFGELDAENKNIVSRALRYIANKFDFKKILIISHAEELQDSFNNIIRVTFDGKSSHIEKEILNEESSQHIEKYDESTKIV